MVRFIAILVLALPLAHSKEPKKKDWWKINCVPLATVDKEIKYCLHNPKGVKHAQNCYDELITAWNLASVDVAEVQKLSHAKGQEGEFGNSNSKYQSSINRLRYLVESTEKSADLLALYPTVMVDMAGVETKADSLPCYQDAFNSVQKLVSDLDKKTREGKAALAEAEKLQASVQISTGNLKATDSANTIVTGGKNVEGAPKSFDKKKNRGPSSTITGEIHRDNQLLPEQKK